MPRRELGRPQVQAANKASSCWERSGGEWIGEAHLLVLNLVSLHPKADLLFNSELWGRAQHARSFKMHVAASC